MGMDVRPCWTMLQAQTQVVDACCIKEKVDMTHGSSKQTLRTTNIGMIQARMARIEPTVVRYEVSIVSRSSIA